MSMYQINQTVQSEGMSTKIFPLGLTENVEMTDVAMDVATNGNSYLKYVFTSEDGSIVSHFEWPIDQNSEGWEKRLQSQMKRVKHILTKFLPEEDVEITADSFENFGKQVIAKLGNSYVGKKLRVKTVYSYNNYISVPKYVPFMEVIDDVDMSKSRLNVTSFDKMEKDEADNPAALTSTAPQNGAATEPAESDLPF